MDILNTFVRMLDGYPFQLLLCAIVFSSSFQKRKLFWPRVVVYAMPMLIIYDFGQQEFPNGIVENYLLDRCFLLLPVVYIFVGLLICYHCTPTQALFCAASAQPAQNIVFNLYWIGKMHLGFEQGSLDALPVSIGIMLVVCTIMYYAFARKLRADSSRFAQGRVALSAVIIMILVVFFDYRVPGTPMEESVYIAYVIADLLALVMQFGLFYESSLENKNAILEQLLHAEQKNQQMAAENVELINRKCHDLKHQIAGLRQMEAGLQRDEYIRQIEKAVMFYESSAKTGNKTLDTILMAKQPFCQEHHITLSCVSDGERLDCIDPMDLYTLFGNAIDNAIECVSQESETSKRIISMRIGPRGNFLSIHIENYVGHEVKLSNGLPVTTKADHGYHGFGMLSIQRTVEKYDGTMRIRADDHLFKLDILLPIPSKSAC